MRHLTASELLDLAEGAGMAATATHLASCEACRQEVKDLQATLSVAAAVDVPEPSPLYWEHFSARVREGVDAEGRQSAAAWRPRWASWGVIVPVGALAMILVAAAVWGPARDSSTPVAPGAAVTATIAAGSEASPPGEDASLALLAALGAELDWDAASEVGLAPQAGALDELVSSLSSGERGELRRLLAEALTPSGA